MPRTTEAATRALTGIECNRRRWTLHETSWKERYKAPTGFVVVTRDLFGFADGVVLRPGETIALQWTTAHNANARVRKIKANAIARECLAAGWRILVWGFDLDRGVLAKEIEMVPEPNLAGKRPDA